MHDIALIFHDFLGPVITLDYNKLLFNLVFVGGNLSTRKIRRE